LLEHISSKATGTSLVNEVVRRGKSILPVVSYCTKFDICASNDVSIHLGLKFAISFLFSHVQSSLKLLEPYLTLPYLPDKTFYCLALRSPRGSLRIPELTVRLQNLQVHNSPGSTPVMGLFPSPSENTLLGLPTVRQSQYLRENFSFISTATLVAMTCKSQTRKIQETHLLN